MALPVNGSTHLLPAYCLIYRPRKDERLSWPSWLTYSGRFTHISLVVTHQLQVERSQRPTLYTALCHQPNTKLRLRMTDPCKKLKSLVLAVAVFYMGCKILKRVTWPWPCPFQGRFFIGRMGLAMISQRTKFEVSRFTVTKLWMAVQNAENEVVWGHSRSSAMLPFDRVHTTSYSTLIETMCLSCTVFEI